MPFLKKLPCTAPRVLSFEDCPPDNVPHLPSEYPCYYDAIYYPDFHPSVYTTSQSFCLWLSLSLEHHHLCCSSCQSELPSDISVNYTSDLISVNVGSCSERFSIPQIESSSFSVCRLHRLLSNVRVKPAPPLDT